ncbi:MAG: FAD-dependent oxidoreductase [Herminiimonas sp.]|nr:FAD-dependent oxidoreductase [Herminiimonas sp.]
MNTDFQQRRFAYQRCADHDAAELARHPVVVVGAGPVGLATAIDLAQHGVEVLLLDDDDCLSSGSRAICFAKRTLEIFDRLGCCAPMMEKGVSWNIGKVFFRDQPVYSFNLLAEEGHCRPAFINLQQYYVEGFLQERAAQLPGIDMRWKNRVTGLAQQEDGVTLTVDTPDGSYRVKAEYVVAADGVRSPVRAMMGLESRGRVFNDRFLIADVKMKAAFPSERWFWFDPPFHPNQSVLLHRQPDNVWRIDFQLGVDADPVLEKTPERVLPRLRALFGEDVEFELEWVSVYTFACRRMEKFRHGRVLFAGDAAHGVSPFGARGANSGIQDADNLAWKLALVLQGRAPDALLDSYAFEREQAADENILNSTRSTDFITPKSAISRLFRDATLTLARDHAFARRLVNSGRLSLPTTYDGSLLNTHDSSVFAGCMRPGAPCADAPVHCAEKDGGGWFLGHLGARFYGVYFAGDEEVDSGLLDTLKVLSKEAMPVMPLIVKSSGGAERKSLDGAKSVSGAGRHNSAGIAFLDDTEGLLAQRYDAAPGTFYLVRPDQHVCARWRSFDLAQVRAALACAMARQADQAPGDTEVRAITA